MFTRFHKEAHWRNRVLNLPDDASAKRRTQVVIDMFSFAFASTYGLGRWQLRSAAREFYLDKRKRKDPDAKGHLLWLGGPFRVKQALVGKPYEVSLNLVLPTRPRIRRIHH